MQISDGDYISSLGESSTHRFHCASRTRVQCLTWWDSVCIGAWKHVFFEAILMLGFLCDLRFDKG